MIYVQTENGVGGVILVSESIHKDISSQKLEQEFSTKQYPY